MKTKNIIVSVALIALVLCVGCDQSSQSNPLVGTWRNDNTYSFSVLNEPIINGHYVIVGNLITFDNNPSGYKTFQYSQSGDTLSLSVDGGDGTIQTYIR